MIPLKITFVFNNTNWATEQEKVDTICAFYKPDFDITAKIVHTNFTNIPFKTVGTIGGIENTLGTTTTVTPEWYSQNITPLAPDSDIILLYLNSNDDNPPRTSVGICQGVYNNVVQTCIFGINETDHSYIYNQQTGLEMDQGNCFVNFASHEISHALYLMQQIPDNTHIYFYSGHPEKVIPELAEGKLTGFYKMIAYLKQQILLLTTQINQLKIKPTPMPMPTPTPQPVPSDPLSVFPVMIRKWMVAIGNNEGAEPGTFNRGNLKYTPLTASWGAIQGRAATDGGHLAKFHSQIEGDIALCKFLVLGCEDHLLAFHQTKDHPDARTLVGFTKIYAGNPPVRYINAIVAELGVPGDTNIASFIA